VATETPLLIRDEQPPHGKQVREVNEAAFGRSDEADLIDKLRVEGATLLCLSQSVTDKLWVTFCSVE